MRKSTYFLLFLVFLLLLPVGMAGQDFYWENPSVLASGDTRFPSVRVYDDRAVVMWYEYERLDEEIMLGYVSFAYSQDGSKWALDPRSVGPVRFTGEPVPFASMLLDNQLTVAYTSDANIITVLQTTFPELLDGSFTANRPSFSELSRLQIDSISVIPRLVRTSNNTMKLFITRMISGEGLMGTGMGITFSSSVDGRIWTGFAPLSVSSDLSLNFLPTHTRLGNRDYVVFQVFKPGRNASNQLYMVISDDGGRTYSAPQLVTGFPETRLESATGVFDNQRPFLTNDGEQLFLSWERKAAGTTASSIYLAAMDRDGNFLPGYPDRVSRLAVSARSPEVFFINNRVYVLWFDNRAGDDRIILARRDGFDWRDTELTRISGSSVFGKPVILNEDLYIVWENRIAATSTLMLLEPDTTVPTPVLRSLDFSDNRAARQDTFQVSWTIGPDSSGVSGFSYSVSSRPEDPPTERFPMLLNTVRQRTVDIEADGTWYFNLKAQDFAGNWSETSRVRMVRDTTPPSPPVIPDLPLDANGFLPSNSFTIEWQAPPETDVAGYSYAMSYLAGPQFSGDLDRISIPDPPQAVMTSGRSMSFTNRDNGLWVLAVSAIDHVGNVSEPAHVFFRMNKYIPVTFITSMTVDSDIFTRSNISIQGRGFSAGGNVHTIILDRDGSEPYDYMFDESRFRVVNDRLIQDLIIDDVMEGSYRVGLIHPQRGIYFSSTRLELESSGIVKFGDFTWQPVTFWESVSERLLVISLNRFVFILLLVLLTVTAFFCTRKIVLLLADYQRMEIQISNFLTGRRETVKKGSKGYALMKKKGIGLRLKFSLLIMILITMIVLMVSLAMGQYMIRTQQRNLVEGLQERSQVLLESLSTGTRAYPLVSTNILEIGLLPGQSDAMADALYVTITGAGIEDENDYNYIWATNDANLLMLFDDGRITPGYSYLEDGLSNQILQIRDRINEQAAERVGAITAEIDRLNAEAIRVDTIRLRNPGDQQAEDTYNRLLEEIRQFDIQLNMILNEIADVVYSYPEFDAQQPDLTIDKYVFYKPIVYRLIGDDLYFRGIIRLGVSTEGIRQELITAQQILIRISAIIAIISALFGVLGALLLASIIIRPIRRLVAGVEIIRDTDDKEQLKNHLINTRTRDELAMLADAINQMTQGLVKAAQANKELIVGKEVQKMFIPLDKDEKGNKLSTGGEINDHIELFGYYEGAKGVSGDYYDYIKLDDRHYAMILCDIAGKGVSASLIMVEVATIFLNYFKTALAQNKKTSLPELVYSINDLIEERGFRGRFAALIVGLLDIQTGKMSLCNAGYKFVHCYSAAKRSVWSKTLNEAPAAGVFPNFMVEMKGGFIDLVEILSVDDCVFLYSDGIEESQRKFRDKDFEIIKCSEPGLKEGEYHDTHPLGNDNEELTNERLHNVINAVFSKGSYQLHKYHDPVSGQHLVFDFTSCQGTVREAVMAMVAVEKVFRLNPNPGATIDDRIAVDRKVNDFLKEHFVQYSSYFNSPVDEDKESMYVHFGYLMEDEQYDDLTILAIRKL